MRVLKKRRITSLFIALLMMLSVVTPVLADDIYVTSIDIKGDNSVEIGSKIGLVAVVKDQNGDEMSEEEVTWDSEDTDTATVDEETGEVTGVKAGSVNIKATSKTDDTVTEIIEITVEEAEELSEVASIEISGENSVEIGSRIELVAVVKDQNGDEMSEEEVTWDSEDTDTATVDEETGEVTGVKAGSVNIRATSKTDDTVTETIEITVEEAEELSEVASIEIKGDNSVEIESKIELVAVVKDQNGDEMSEEEVTWDSEDTDTATVDEETGEVTGVKAGSVNIRATSKTDIEIKKTIEIIVEGQQEAESLKVATNGINPGDGAEGIATNTDISVVFNQEIQPSDNESQEKIEVFYDENDDGEVDDEYGDKSKHELIFDEKNPKKVSIQIKDEDGENIELEENHVYRINLLKGFIEAKAGGEVLDENITWTFDTEVDIQPLEVDRIRPENGTSGVSKDAEISVTFNQDIKFKDNGTPVQVAVFYDKNNGGEANEPYGNIFEHKLVFDEDEADKVVIQLKDEEGENIELEENHVYRIDMVQGFIDAKAGGEVLDENITWTFGTSGEVQPKSLEVDRIRPEDGASGVSKDAEISVTFNQDIKFRDNGTPVQVAVFYDKDNGGDANEPYGNIFEHKLVFDEDEADKVVIQLKDEEGENIELEENHVYRIDMVQGFIEAKAGGEVLDENITWTFGTSGEVQPKSLEVDKIRPEDGASGVSKDAEISVTFNQDIKFKDNGTPVQVAVFYDKDNGGEANEPYGNIFEHKLVFDEDEADKVVIQLKDEEGENIELEENHVYRIDMVQGFIEAKAGGEVSDENITWTFDTKGEVLEVVCPIDGKTINPEDEIFIKAGQEVEETYVDELYIYLYEEDELIIEGSGADLAELDDENKRKIIIDIGDELEIGHAYKIKVTSGEEESPKDLITFSFKVENLEEYDLKIKLDFLRKEEAITGGQSFIAASMNDGVIYAVRDNNGMEGSFDKNGIRIYAFDLYGHELWNTRIDDIFTTNSSFMPVYGEDGSIYIQTLTSNADKSEYKTQLFSIKSNDGTIRWKKEIDGSGGLSKTQPIIIDDEIIIATEKGLYSYDEDGGFQWDYRINKIGLEAELEDYIIENPPIRDKDGNIYIAVKGKNTSIDDGKVQVINSDGSEKWSYVTASGVIPPVIDSKGKVYVIDNTCIIGVLNSSDGSIVTEHPFNGYELSTYDNNILSINVGTDDTIYTVVGDRKLLALNPDGTEKYIYKNGDHIIGDLVIDHEGYGYYSEEIDSGAALFVIDPYGSKAAEILPVGSTMPDYKSIFIDGNVLLAAKDYSTNVIAAKIERRIPEQPNSIEIIEKNKSLGINLRETLAVTVRNTQGKVMIGEELEWTSSDDSIVEATQDGSLICKKEGTATITVKVKGREISDSTTVEVIEKPSMPNSIEILNEDGEAITDELTVEYGIPYQFKVKVFDQYGKTMYDEELVWFSIINYFPAIDSNGLLNPKTEGRYTLKVISCTDVKVTDEIAYKIEKKSGIYSDIYPREAVMSFPGSMTLSTVDQYSKAINLEDIKWTSSNEGKVTVNDEGELTAKDYGTVNVTGSSNGVDISREVSVVPTFGYEWNIKGTGLNLYMDEGEDGTLYYVDGNELVSLDGEHKTDNWRLEIGEYISYIEVGQKGNIYCLGKNGKGQYHISSINIDKTIEWQCNLELGSKNFINNIEETDDGTIYIAASAARSSNIYAIDKNGNNKWKVEFDKRLSSFILDNENNIICATNNSTDSVVVKIKDEDDEGIIVDEDTLDVLSFGKGSIEVDDNGVVYGYFCGEENQAGVCAVKDGEVKWKYEDGDQLTDVCQITLSDEGVLYFILRNCKNSYSLYKMDNKGNEIWKKNINDLSNPERFLITSGAFSVDGIGNICIPVTEVKTENFSTIYVNSKIFRVDASGSAIQYIGYDISKYGFFEYVYLSKNMYSIYVIGKHVGSSEESMIKFAFESNGEVEVDEIRITTYKNSIIKGESLQLEAKVYSQFGSLMSNEAVTWSSEDEDIAIIDSNGLVAGMKAGETDIIAQSITNPEIKGILTLRVLEAGAHYVSKDEMKERTQLTVDYYKKKGIPQGDWIAFGLSAAGENIISDEYMSNGRSYIDNLWNIIGSKNDLGEITEYEKATLGILAGGYDPHNFAGMNLIERIYDYGSLGQGNNAAVWALIALDAVNAQVPEGQGYFTQEYLIDYLLTHKSAEGWAVSDDDVNIDITGMALYALAPYKDRPNVKDSIDEAVEWLKTEQNENGSFNCFDSSDTNTESTAQIIMGLTALGIDPQGDDFIRGGGNPVSAMLNNQLADGSFEHTKSFGSNKIATEQALQALAALKDFYEKGSSTIFYHIPYNSNMGTVTVRIEGQSETILPEAIVNISLGTTTLMDAITSVLDDKGIKYKLDGELIQAIKGEDGWKPIVNNNTQGYTSSSVLEGGEVIILVDDEIINPKVTRLRTASTKVDKDKEFTIRLEKYNTDQSNFIPVSDQEIIFDGQEKITDSEGQVTFMAKEEGNFYVTARTHDNLIRPVPVLVRVEIPDTPSPNPGGIEQISIAPVNTSLRVGDKTLLSVTALDNNNSEIAVQNIIWSSSNENIIKFDKKVSEKIIAISQGTATITASLQENPLVTDSITFTVQPNTREVYIRVEGYDHTILPRTRLEVPLFDLDEYLGEPSGSSGTPSDGWGVEKFKNPTNAHAVVRALERAGVGYDFQDYGWSIYMSMINGDREFDKGPNSGWLFRVNDAIPSIGSESKELRDGDDILWYYAAYGYKNLYTKLYMDKTSIKVGEEVGLRLGGPHVPVAGATILVNGKEHSIDEEIVKTDINGRAILVFDEEGNYKISAIRYKNGDGNKIDIVRPASIAINVTQGDEEDIEPPNILVDGLINGSVTEKNISFTIVVTDNVDENILPIVKLNGGLLNGRDGRYEAVLREGENIIVVEATDQAANISVKEFKMIYESPQIDQEIEDALNEIDIPVDNEEPLRQKQETVNVMNPDEKMSEEESKKLEEELKENKVEMSEEVTGDKDAQMVDEKGEVKLVLPASAIKNPVKIRITEEVGYKEAPEESISSIYEFGPSETKFDKPIYIRFKIPLENKELSNLALVWLNEETGKWIPIPAVIDARTGLITGMVNHFTKFAVVDKTMLSKIYTSRIESEGFKNGERANIKVSVKNNDSIDRKATLIMVLYNKDKRLEKWTISSRTIEKGDTAVIEAELEIPKVGDYHVKAMIWDDMEGMKVLSPKIEVDVEK
ncbi:Ig-like domain-containing protein [Wukongibacter sp. M2B1]|uniref:Ig-like domain-containing protein n=1 Tax=Wukongibacter sp. M2B1 TaxID=3088895 RepID=UPI003D7BE726